MMKRLLQAALVLFTIAVTLVASRASAHSLGVSNGDYEVRGARVVAKMTFARGELEAGAPGVGRAERAAAIVAATKVSGDERECPGALVAVGAVGEDGVLIEAAFDCANAPQNVSVRLGFWGEMTHGHRHVLRARGEGDVDRVLFAGEPGFSFRVAGTGTGTGAGLAEFVRLGGEHILSGYDHLLFLLALVVVGGRLRSLLGIVTAFTVAHSITLALAATGVIVPSPRIVEPIIALSIVYVGVENLLVKDAAKRISSRWKITFLFGLVHGFGFAGALREIELPAAKLPVALFGFNLGVELGQLAVMAALLPLLGLLRRRERIMIPSVRLLSGAVVIAGLVWFVERAFGA